MTRTETNTTLLIDRTELQQPMTAFQDFLCNKTLSSSKWMEHGNGISAYHDQTKILDRKKIDKNSESKNWGYFRQLTMPVVSCLVADKPVLVGESCILLLFFTIFLIMTANIVITDNKWWRLWKIIALFMIKVRRTCAFQKTRKFLGGNSCKVRYNYRRCWKAFQKPKE